MVEPQPAAESAEDKVSFGALALVPALASLPTPEHQVSPLVELSFT